MRTPRGFANRIGASASTVVSLTTNRFASGGVGFTGGKAGIFARFQAASERSYSSAARSWSARADACSTSALA